MEVYDKNGVQRDMAWLRQKYGNVQFLDAGSGPKFRLVRVDETEGPAVIKARLQDQQGQPLRGQPVANHWPDSSLPDLRNAGLKTLWRDRAVYQLTDSAGFTGFGLGTGSYIGNLQDGGPHVVWVLSPSLPSDGISGLGMLGGTVHEGPLFLTFQIADSGGGGGGSGGSGGMMPLADDMLLLVTLAQPQITGNRSPQTIADRALAVYDFLVAGLAERNV